MSMTDEMLKHPSVSKMTNGHQEVSYDSLSLKNDAEMLEQIKQLLHENNNLKETMKQMNQGMKERLEELLKRHNQRLVDLNSENELLRKELHSLKVKAAEPFQETFTFSATDAAGEAIKQMKTQLTRLQTEKADLLGIISELQLKLGSFSSDDSFVEIRISEKDSGVIDKEDNASYRLSDHNRLCSRTNSLKEENGIEQEEMAISRLLHSLREETQKVEKLKTELLSANERVAYLEKQTSDLCEKEIQTENETVQNRESQCELIISGEVDLLKQKVKSLNKELQEASVKLNGAEHLKIKLQDKLKENQVSLDEKQSLAYAVKKLELHVESLQSAIKMEQNKTEVEKEQLTSLQAAYEKLNLEYQELRRNECEKVSKEEFKELLQKLDACEKALAKKQFEIDEMKETVTKHKEDMETIELLRAQIDLFCSDFHAERSARENIHQEKEELAAHLAFMMQENEKLKEEITGRQSIEQLQKRHGSTMSGDGSESPCLVPRGMESIYQQDLPVHTCPKCNLNVPDIDTLQIHVMDCIT